MIAVALAVTCLASGAVLFGSYIALVTLLPHPGTPTEVALFRTILWSLATCLLSGVAVSLMGLLP